MYIININQILLNLFFRAVINPRRACVKHDGLLSESFVVERGIRQGSVLSPTLFLVVMDLLLRNMSQKSIGLSIHDLYVGSGGHADDIHTIAANKSSLMSQTLLVRDFTENTCLKLNVAKCDVVRMTGRSGLCGEKIDLASHTVETQDKAKCLGIWLRCDLSAKTSVKENIVKARRAFFGMGNVGAFQGTLNPLSDANIYAACVIPVLLYGCETWILDHPCLTVLENFQAEIGKRILHPPPHHPNNAVRVGLQWPSVASRILIRKLTYLAKLMTSDNQISAKLFSSLAIEDIYQISIVQQCKLQYLKSLWEHLFSHNV